MSICEYVLRGWACVLAEAVCCFLLAPSQRLLCVLVSTQSIVLTDPQTRHFDATDIFGAQPRTLRSTQTRCVLCVGGPVFAEAVCGLLGLVKKVSQHQHRLSTGSILYNSILVSISLTCNNCTMASQAASSSSQAMGRDKHCFEVSEREKKDTKDTGVDIARGKAASVDPDLDKPLSAFAKANPKMANKMNKGKVDEDSVVPAEPQDDEDMVAICPWGAEPVGQ